jgi:serpin B
MKTFVHLMLASILLFLAACAPQAVEPGETPPGPAEPEPAPTALPPTPTEPQQPLPTPLPGGNTAGIQQIRADIPRETNPAAGQDELRELAEGNSRFALDLYQILKEENGNLFYSPYSISLALAMTFAGARGDTQSEMADALNFTLPEENLHEAMNALDQALADRGQRGNEPDSFRLNIVNSLWGQEGYAFLQEYLELIARHYGAGMNLVDFTSQAEASRELINEWVSEQTEGRIEDLLPQGSVDDLTRLVLVNAIYFNARWAAQFQEENTQDRPFNLLDGSQVQVPMMNQTEYFNYGRGQGYQVVELPYDGYEMAMTILLPDEGQFEQIENSLNLETLSTALEAQQRAHVRLSMPSFSYDSSFSLSSMLQELGMQAAFEPRQADFSGIDGTRELFIKEVVHKAFVAVDEKGTEAAAATGVVVGIESMPAETIELTIDRPFIYLIRDLETGAILFLGRVLNPAE